MLVDQNIGETSWAYIVLQYSSLDKAAIGVELSTSLSVNAIDGRTVSSLESTEFCTFPEIIVAVVRLQLNLKRLSWSLGLELVVLKEISARS